MEKKKSLEKVGLGIAAMFVTYWIYILGIGPYLPLPDIAKTILGLISLYGVGLTLFLLITRTIPTQKPEKKKVPLKQVGICFLLQFTALMLFSIITNIVLMLTHTTMNEQMQILDPLMLFLLLIFNPIIEEFVFRKLFADRLLPYGELFYIIVSSFCFAIVHSVSVGIPQIFYTFILGLLWSYLVVKTGSIKIPIILHALSNLFGAVIITILQGISQEAVGMYSMFMVALAISGLILFIVNKDKIMLDDSNKLIRGNTLKEIFTNKGIIIYFVLTAITVIVKSTLK